MALVLNEARTQTLASLYQRFPESQNTLIILISINDQRLYLIDRDQCVNEFIISTASAGMGNIAGSYKTPLGIHQIKEKIGRKAESGAIFKARRNTHEIATILTDPDASSDADNITSRILWLWGLEEGVNQGYDYKKRLVDSYQRYIYIHGTDEEGKLGQPSSHGCIRMANADVIALFEQVDEGCFVLMSDV